MMLGVAAICDCCRSELVVLCHDRGETEYAEGTLSRINPSDGSVVWTIDFGDIDSTYWNAARACDIDSHGNIYVVTQAAKNTAFWDWVDFNTAHPAATIWKVDASGTILASYELPTRSSDNYDPFVTGEEINRGARVAVDWNDDDRIYVGADRDTDGNWLHRFDASLAVVWSVGTEWTGGPEGAGDHRSAGRCVALRVSEEGKPYARCSGYQSYVAGSWGAEGESNRFWEFDPADGSPAKAYDGSGYSQSGSNFADFAFDNNYIPSRLRAASYRYAGPASSAYNYGLGTAFKEDIEDANNPPQQNDWVAYYGLWEAMAIAENGAGVWDDIGVAHGIGVLFDGGNGFVIFATRSRQVFDVTSGSDASYNLFAANRSDGSAAWLTLSSLTVTFGAAYDPDNGGSYLAGYGLTGGTHKAITKFNPDDGAEIWASAIYTSHTGFDGGVCVAARTVTG